MLSKEIIEEINGLNQNQINHLLYNAVKNNNLLFADFLLFSPLITMKPPGEQRVNSLLYNAVESNDIELVEFLLSNPNITIRPDINLGGSDVKQDFLLLIACSNGNLKMIEFLLQSPNIEKHCDINNNLLKPLEFASMYNQINVINFLLESKLLKVNLDIKGEVNKLLTMNAKNGHLEIIKILLETAKFQDCFNNSDWHSAVLEACQNNHKEVVQYLLTDKVLSYFKTSPDIYQQNSGGKDIFMMTCLDMWEKDAIKKRWDVIEYLVLEYNLSYEKEKDFLEENKDNPKFESIHNLFKMRDLHQKLNKEIGQKETAQKKNKI